MTAGMNVLNGIDETRNWFVVRFWAIVYTIVFIFAIIIVLILMVFTEYIQSLLDQAFGVWGILVAIVSVRPLIRGLVVGRASLCSNLVCIFDFSIFICEFLRSFFYLWQYVDDRAHDVLAVFVYVYHVYVRGGKCLLRRGAGEIYAQADEKNTG